MAYRYKAYTVDKKVAEGTIEAVSENVAEDALYQAGYRRILSLREIRAGRSLEDLLPTLFGVKAQDVVDFSRQLATLIDSGVSILTALQLLQGQASSPGFRKVIMGLVTELRGGKSLSQALAKYPQAFSEMHCQIVKAGEQAGSLALGLRQIAGYMEKQLATKKKVRRAMSYPVLVLLMAVGVLALLFSVALPPLVGLFTSLGAELPLMTRVLIRGADFLVSYKLYLFPGLLAMVILVIGYVRLPTGRLAMDRLMLKMPIIGSIVTERQMSHFCYTASMTLKAGLRLPQIMDIITQTTGNQIIRQALGEVRRKLVQGQGLSRLLGANGLFPQLLVEMVAVGEKTGTLESSLATVADYYEQRVDQRIDSLVSMIEPALTVVIGLVIVFIALSMLTPLYSILRSMQ